MSNNSRPIIGIIECGRFSDEMTDVHGTYTELYSAILGTDVFDYRTFAVHLGDRPTVDDADAWVISGSRHGAYEDHDWIPPTEEHIRNAYAANQPIVGVCFGHQILAKAMGGTVEKFVGGWQMGHVNYDLSGPFDEVVDTRANLLAFHQDQVVELPKDATVIGTTEHCQYAALQYGKTAISIQPHPEFNDTLVNDLLEERGHLFPKDDVTNAYASLGNELHNDKIASVLRNFILQGLA